MTENELLRQIQLLRDGHAALGDLIAHLERSPLLDVASYSGETTWQGPTPDAFNETVALQCEKLRGIVDELGMYRAYLPDRIWAFEQELGQLRAREAALTAAGME